MYAVYLVNDGGVPSSFSFAYDASLFTPPSPWGAFVIFVPVVGGILGQMIRMAP